MMFFRALLFVCPAVCLLAQTPPKPATPSAAPPLPTVTLSSDVAAGAPSVAPDKVVLTVGDVKITAAQFDHIINSLPPQYQQNARGAGRKQFADNVVRILVLAQEGKRRKLDDTAAYKDQQMFQSANMLAGLTYDALGKDAKVDDAEIQKYYDAHKGEFERVKARHILIRAAGSPLPVRPGAKEVPEADALAKAQEIRKKIEGGADFAELARTESDDTTSGAQGGDLGFFGRNQMVPPFEEAAFAMKAGELSQPVKTPFGYHIIKVEARESKSLDEMRPEIEKRLRPELAQKNMEELQKKSAVQMDPEFFGTGAAPVPAPVPAPSLVPPVNK
jgi:peptidyl-prolyl cis-trans isomerase C